MGLLSLALKIAEQELEPFIAPIPTENVKVHTVQEAVPFSFDVRGDPGWWLLRPVGHERVTFERPAIPFEYLGYLEQLPRFYVRVGMQVSSDQWLVFPFNAADATQRGWTNGEPRIMYLTRHRLRALDVCVARAMGDTLLYERLDDRLGESAKSATLRIGLVLAHSFDRWAPDVRNVAQVILEHDERLRAERERRAEEDRRQQVENRLRWHLDYAGAQMTGWNVERDNFRVSWEFQGREYSALVRPDMRVQSAGICLAGRDLEQNLTSIVRVLDRGDDDDWY